MSYLTGLKFGLPESIMIHPLANIAGKVKCGEHCRIDAFVTITGEVEIGERTHIATGVSIFGVYGVKIGSCCSLSPGAKIFTATDDPRESLLANPQLQEKYYRTGSVVVGDFSVIAANAVVLPGVNIGESSYLGANSLLKDDLPSGEVWGGTPAHFLFVRAKLDKDRMR